MNSTNEILESLVGHLRGFGVAVHRCRDHGAYLNLTVRKKLWVRVRVVSSPGGTATLELHDAKHERFLITANLGRIAEFDDGAARFTSGWIAIRARSWLWELERELRAAAAGNGE